MAEMGAKKPAIDERRKRKFGDEEEEGETLLDLTNMSPPNKPHTPKRRALSRKASELRSRSNTVVASPMASAAKRVRQFSRSVSAKSLLTRNKRSSKKKTSRGYFGSPCKTTSTSSLWCETLGENKDEVLRTLSGTGQKRQEAIFELTKGEEQYANDLVNLERVFMKPMRALRYITNEEETRIFGNVIQLAEIHAELGSNLKAARCEVNGVESIGAIFQEWLPKTSAYASYCSNQALAKLALKAKARESEGLRHFLETTQDMKLSRRQDIWSFLDAPRRRLQRYPLLLKAVLKNTETDKDEYTVLQQVVKQFEAVIKKVDRSIADDSASKTAEIQSSLEFAHSWQKVDLVGDGRPLLMEARATLARDGKSVYLFLFAHMFIMTKDSKRTPGARTVIGRPIPLESLVIEDIHDEQDATIRIRNADTSSFMGTVKDSIRGFSRTSSAKGKSYNVQFLSSDAKASWVSTINSHRPQNPQNPQPADAAATADV